LAAVTYGDSETVTLLLLLGADPNLADQYNYTALHEAACLGYREVTEILIEAKADINKRDINDYSPLGYAVRCGHQGVIELLQAHGAILSPATPDINEAP
jgi:ankyrin repeat protein